VANFCEIGPSIGIDVTQRSNLTRLPARRSHAQKANTAATIDSSSSVKYDPAKLEIATMIRVEAGS
jgi:hypothetical protein